MSGRSAMSATGRQRKANDRPRMTGLASLPTFAGSIHSPRDARRMHGCWAECEVVPNALYSGDMLREVFRGR